MKRRTFFKTIAASSALFWTKGVEGKECKLGEKLQRDEFDGNKLKIFVDGYNFEPNYLLNEFKEDGEIIPRRRQLALFIDFKPDKDHEITKVILKDPKTSEVIGMRALHRSKKFLTKEGYYPYLIFKDILQEEVMIEFLEIIDDTPVISEYKADIKESTTFDQLPIDERFTKGSLELYKDSGKGGLISTPLASYAVDEFRSRFARARLFEVNEDGFSILVAQPGENFKTTLVVITDPVGQPLSAIYKEKGIEAFDVDSYGKKVMKVDRGFIDVEKPEFVPLLIDCPYVHVFVSDLGGTNTIICKTTLGLR